VIPATTTYLDRPDLVERLDSLADPWPEFIHHANCNRLWHVMRERFAQFQLILYDEENDRPLGRGQTIPVRWDGSVDGLPGGVDDAVEHGPRSPTPRRTRCVRSSPCSTERRRATVSAGS
jgi:hypothetical protein